MLHDNTLLLERQIDGVPRFPGVTNAIEDCISLPLQHIDGLSALKFKATRSPTRWDNLAKEHQGGESRILDRRVQIPLHLPEGVGLHRQLVAPDHLNRRGLTLSLRIAQADEFIPVIRPAQHLGTIRGHRVLPFRMLFGLQQW